MAFPEINNGYPSFSRDMVQDSEIYLSPLGLNQTANFIFVKKPLQPFKIDNRFSEKIILILAVIALLRKDESL